MIKLRKNWEHTFISEASWEKAGRKNLVVLGYYLHKALWLYRKVKDIKGDYVYWSDLYTDGACTIAVFLATCKTIATKEEIDFINKNTN